MDHYRIRRIKGDIVEAVCKNHFAAMGFQIENAGVEHFATQFANRSSRFRGQSGGSNVNKIQNYIGRLPDLLIGHEKHDHHFVEAKFRDAISIYDFAQELLWDYRKQIFGREFDHDIFSNLTKTQWTDETSAYDLSRENRAHLDAFMKSVTQGGIEPDQIQVPMMFYVLIKNGKIFSLFLIRFDTESGNFQIHQAGKSREIASTDIATRDFLSDFDKYYSEVVAPILREVFSADVEVAEPPPSEAQRTILQGSILDVCMAAALKLKRQGRNGVYFGELLKEDSVVSWLKNAQLSANRENLKIELEKCGVSGAAATTFTLDDGSEIDLRIKIYTGDFDFYMK
ncbi:hypothetical protein WJ542_11705 [Paraburkholderia sp. B3]|uniref:hypothetical protein n=1 Tax=Paraburkholderia sp. B3 TaxID=3134791 RepID=UPI003981CC4B